jgi:hypothetical protein
MTGDWSPSARSQWRGRREGRASVKVEAEAKVEREKQNGVRAGQQDPCDQRRPSHVDVRR